MSRSQPNLAIEKDIGKGSPRLGENGHGTSLATCPLAGAPFSWLGPDTCFAHTVVGREGACRPSSCCPVPYRPGHWASFPDLFLLLHSQRLRQNHSLASGITPQAYPQLGVCSLTNGRASQGPVSQWQLFLGSPGPMMLPPIPFDPPLCVPIAEKGTGTKGVGIMGSPISGPASEWASPHLPTQFNCA